MYEFLAPGEPIWKIAGPPKAPSCPIPAARGLNRHQAAAYIGVSASLFDQMVEDGRMPKPRRANARTIWDRRALDQAFEQLPGGEDNYSQPESEGGEWDTEA